MTTTPPEAPPEPDPYRGGPRTTADEVRDLGRLRRTAGPEKRIAGVAGGLARHLDIDPVILRVAFVVLVFFGGAGLIAYGACWLLVPQDDEDRAPIHLDERNRTVALIGAGVVALVALLGDSVGGVNFPWPLALIALVAVVVLTAVNRRDRPRPTAPPVPHYPVPGAGGTQASATAWAPTGATGPTTAWAPPPRVRNPRRRGPILFWFTLALAALGVGVLGIVDVAGATVAGSAYPALVVATSGVMLLVGAFYGRAGGLILVGLLASLSMLAASVVDHVDDLDERHPTTAADVESRYDMHAGELTLDLTGVTDLDALNGRVIHVQVGAGRLEVLVPSGLDVVADAQVGLGHTTLFGEERDGGGIDTSNSYDGGTDVPDITLDIEMGVGEIYVSVSDALEPTTPGASS